MSQSKARKKAKRAIPLAERVEEAYWDHVLEHGSVPASVYRFCKQLSVSEGEFFKEFSNFDAVEARYWERGIRECLEALDADEDTAAYTAAQWLSAFYFTYFEMAVENRSKFLARFPNLKEGKSPRLSGWHRAFGEVADRFIEKAVEESSIAGGDRLKKAQKRAVVFQARSLVDFHLQDTSPRFEDTDALIEKSVRFVFEAARLPLIDSAVDLARFIIPRVSRG
mgnify:CR=1 FL=1